MMDSPQLRFKDFKLDIEYKELKEFISLIQSGLSRQLKDEDIGLPVLRSNNIQDNSIDIEDIKYWYLNDPQGANTSNYFLEKNDLLVNFINSISQIGKSAIYQNELNRNAILTTNIFRLRFNKLINPLYIGYFFQTKKYFDYIQSITKPAVNQASFTTKEFQKLLVPYVSIEEQTKIANFLTAVDKKILQLNEQYQLMIQYKKGVMQKIISQEIRFKDDNGEEFGEWEERILEDVSIIIMGSSPKSENYNELGIGLPLLQGNADIKNRKSCPRNFTTEITKECDVGDILMSVRAPVGYVAKAMHDACIGRGIAAIRVKENNNQEFLYQYLIYMEDIWGKFSQGSTFDSVNSEQIRNLSIFIPCLQEQTKIADFLTKLDDKIEKVALQLEQVKMWKKGLLQQMFV